MEEELIEKFNLYLTRGKRLMEEGRYEEAYESLLDALRTVGAVLVYRDTGMLVPHTKLVGFLGKYPCIKDALEKYSKLTGSEETASSLREELEKFKGMMSLPSSEG
ncbi:hypothetical protein [Thermococcus sp.]